jgi:hypothetical protein
MSNPEKGQQRHKPNLRHGAVAVARNGLQALVGIERQDLLERLEWLGEQLISDRGGEVTAAENLLIQDILRVEAVITLILDHVGHTGVSQLDKDGRPDLTPPLKSLATYLNTKRLNLVALGLERKAKDINSLLAFYSGKEKGVDSDHQ